MRIEFSCHGLPGSVDVDVEAVRDSQSLGCDEDNLGFPACTASVTYAGGGYRAMFGWVQLVRSSDAETAEFEKDPYFLFPDVDFPYAFYGHKPTLFDAPGRAHRHDMQWLAHSCLAVTPTVFGARTVTVVAGFSWGFTVQSRRVDLTPAAALLPAQWTAHLPYLQATYPAWQFDPTPAWE